MLLIIRCNFKYMQESICLDCLSLYYVSGEIEQVKVGIASVGGVSDLSFTYFEGESDTTTFPGMHLSKCKH